jgi:cell wall-associated NlpC family hydrolase
VPIVFDDLPPGDPRAIAVNYAIAQAGKPYTQWPAGAVTCGRGGGGCTRTGPDCYDCSGLTQMAYAQSGTRIGPTTYYQITDGVSVPCTAANLNGAATTCWQPGDLALYCNAGGAYHVAMYAYEGMFIESYNCGRGVVFWERTQDSMANLCAVRRVIDPDGQPYVAQQGPTVPLAAVGGMTP